MNERIKDVSRAELYLPNSYVEAIPPVPQNVATFEESEKLR